MQESHSIAEGLRVLEIGSSASVAVAGAILADAGAEVIAIEPPGGSPLRARPAFALWGRGKLSRVADLATAADREAIDGLVREADVLLLGLKPASVERFGLDAKRLLAASPGLVHASVTGFGSDGPHRDVPVHDAVMQARGGRMFEFSTLHGGRRPAFAAAPVVAHGAAMALLAGVFGALRERLRNGGRGQRVETSLVRALTCYDLVGWIPGGPPPLRLEDVPFLPYAVARTADGVWVQFAQNGPALFADFLRVLGLEGEIDYRDAMDPSVDPSRKRAQRALVQARIGERTWDAWQARFAEERNLSAERFLPPGAALDHPQFEAMGDVVELPDAEGRPTRQLGPIIEAPTRPLRPRGPAPSLGNASGGFAARPSAAPRDDLVARATAEAGPGLFAGVTVLELGMWIALPYAATWLAELGARVIKLEPLEGDPMRATGPVGFKLVQGKESLALDLKRPEARQIVHRWVARADALLHSYRPGVPERLGIDYETLREINPGLVYLYNGSFGSRGPRAHAPAFHVTGGAVAGGAWAQAGAGCPPPPDATLDEEALARVARRLELSNEANPDFNSAVTAAAAVAMGLFAREQTGQGLAMETRMMLSNAWMMSADFVDTPGAPARREVDAELNGTGPLHRLYPAAEGWVFLAAPGERDFRRLCEALGLAGLASDPRFASAEGRAVNEAALADALGAAIAKRPADALEADCTARGVACVRADQGPCRSWLFEQDWAREQGLVVDVEDSLVGPYTRYGAPVENGESVPLGGATAAGAESRALLEEVGYAAAEVDRLLAEGVIAEATD